VRKAKRPSLRDMAAKKPKEVAVVAQQPIGATRGSNVGGRGAYKGVLSKVSPETWKQLKHLATELDKPVTDLQVDALNLLFRSHGLPEIATKWVSPEK
jgi:Antitoxin-like ribbon-helix-helix